MKKKVETIDDFFKALKAAVKKDGYTFKLMVTSMLVRRDCGKGFVNSYTIVHEPRPFTYCNPFYVVWKSFYRAASNTPEPPAGWVTAGQWIGLRGDQLAELYWAIADYQGHNPELRARLLKVCGLKEVLHKDRVRRIPHDA